MSRDGIAREVNVDADRRGRGALFARAPLRRQRAIWGWLLLAPMLIVVLGVAGWPLLRTIAFSFTDATLVDLENWRFVGFANYAYLTDDPVWWQAVRNTVEFTLISVGLELMIGMIIALALDARLPGRGLLRATILIPWAIPTIVAAKMWGWIYHDQFGVLNEILIALGLVAERLAWTADPDLALWAVILTDVWKTTPFMTLLLLAGLQMIPDELYEAAKVDGVSVIRVFFRITLPLLSPALLVAVIFRTLDALRIFDLIYVLTSNSENTMSMSVYARQQLIDFQDVGYGSAAATMVFLVIAVFTVIYVTLFRLRTAEEG